MTDVLGLDALDPPIWSRPASAMAVAIGALAARCLCIEVTTWPKPGLVSHIDNGSHADMDANLLLRSAGVLEPFFAVIATAAADGADMARLRAIGIAAEAAMLAETRGVNTHRGAIFGLGLLCAAAGVRGCNARSLGRIVRERWGAAVRHGPVPMRSHGAMAGRRYGVAGARGEAADGFPSVYDVGLPALRDGLHAAQGDDEAARVHATFALIAHVDDTNLLHRGGRAGLAFAQDEAARFLAKGGVGQPDWRDQAARVHAAFVARHLSPGGAADLLAMTLFAAETDGTPSLRP